MKPLNHATLSEHLSDYGLRLHTGLKFMNGPQKVVSIQAVGPTGTAVMSCTVTDGVITEKMCADAYLRIMTLFERKALNHYLWESSTL